MLTKRLGLAALALIPALAAAQEVPPNVQPGQIEDQFETPPEPRATDEVLVVPESRQEAPANAAGIRLTVAEIEIVGASVYTPTQLIERTFSLQSTEVSLGRIYELANAITAVYRNDGYVLSRAFVPEQRFDKSAARVRIQVVEGFVDAVEYSGVNRGRDALIQKMAARVTAESVHHQLTLERFLLLLNDMPGKTATGTYVPVQGQPGAFRVVVAQTQDVANFILSQTNRSSEILGPEQSEVGLTLNSVLGLQEQTNLRYISSDFDDQLNLLALSQSLPLASNGTRLFWSYTDTDSVPEFDEEFTAFTNLETDSTTASIGIEVPLTRSRRTNTDIRFTLTQHEGITQNPALMDLEDRVTSLRAGIRVDWVDNARGVNIVDFELSQGIDALDASESGDMNLSREGGAPDYFKARAYFARVQSLGGPVSLLFAFEGQHSDDILLASEQYGVGGPTFVRGYDASEIVGDSGASGKLELRYNFGSNQDTGSRGMLYAFYDEGFVLREVPTVGQDRRDSRSSAGAGLRFTLWGRLSGYIEGAVPLDEPVSLERSDDARVFGGITLQF